MEEVHYEQEYFIGVKYLRLLLSDHFGEILDLSRFCEYTELSDRQYYRVIHGSNRKEESMSEYSLFRVCFGLGFTYQEAVSLFWFNNVDVFCPGKRYKTMDSILIELDELLDCDPDLRIDCMEDLFKRKRFKPRKHR